MSKDYENILSLLKQHAINDKATLFAHTISKKAFGIKHLYEDLGFETREQFNSIMQELYPSLAASKPQNVRWKKFLFDMIDSVAPACKDCPDELICYTCRG